MKINRTGVTRIVIELKNYVIKIPNFTHSWNHFLRGIIGNLEESLTWKFNSGQYNNGTEHLLCPVNWCSWGGWILIMSKAEPINVDSSQFENLIVEHIQHFKGDDKIDNYGILNGKIVKIDYANLDHFSAVF